MNTDKYQDIEDLIKTGQSAKARLQLQKLVVSKLPRNRLSFIASLCRSSGVPELALKVLKPVVRPQNPNIQATPSEIAQYGQSLISLGGSEEAAQLLNNSTVIASEPKALLFLSFAYFAQWNYEAAIPHLEEYLKRVDPASYTHSVGQVNYAAALIAVGNLAKAETILLPLISFFEEKKHQILAGNCKELLAQIYYHRNEAEKAKPILEDAILLLGGKLPDTLFVKKWQCLIQIKSEGPNPKNLGDLNDIREQAKKHYHWETLRDLDFHQSLLTNDLKLYNQVYFGTPFPQLREKIQNKTEMVTKKTFIRNISDATQVDLFYDIKQMDRSEKAPFKTGSLYHRLFLALANDFYRPLRLPTLFAKLYPDEYFEPESSSQKVKMLISRLRKIIHPMGFSVAEIGGTGYTLTSYKPIGLVYRDSPKTIPQQAMDSRVLRLHEKLENAEFKSQDVADIFKISVRSASRWLKEMVNEGFIEKYGNKKGARYRLSRKSA